MVRQTQQRLRAPTRRSEAYLTSKTKKARERGKQTDFLHTLPPPPPHTRPRPWPRALHVGILPDAYIPPLAIRTQSFFALPPCPASFSADTHSPYLTFTLPFLSALPCTALPIPKTTNHQPPNPKGLPQQRTTCTSAYLPSIAQHIGTFCMRTRCRVALFVRVRLTRLPPLLTCTWWYSHGTFACVRLTAPKRDREREGVWLRGHLRAGAKRGGMDGRMDGWMDGCVATVAACGVAKDWGRVCCAVL